MHGFRHERNKFFKRAMDLCFSVALLGGILPLFILILPLIVLFQGFPLFYKSYRYIRSDHKILIYKFRSMVRDAESGKYLLSEKYMKEGYLNIPLDSEVFTSLGRWLERLQLVELPQMVHVLNGQMSLVGNRPLPEINMEYLRKRSHWQERFDSPAGLTGISQVVGKHNLSPDERLRLERMYSAVFRKGNIVLCDSYLLLQTVLLVLFRKTMSVEGAEQFLEMCGGGLS